MLEDEFGEPLFTNFAGVRQELETLLSQWGSDEQEGDDAPVKKKKKSLSGRQAYNVVSDTVGGANVRWKDNLFQAIGISAFVLVGVAVGWFLGDVPGLLVGILGGLISGFLVTGFALMIYRMIKHSRGEHD